MAAITMRRPVPQRTEPAPTPAPWTNADMVKAILVFVVGSLVAGAIALGVAGLLTKSGQDYEDNVGALTAVLISSFIVQEILLLVAAWWFGVRKYHLSFADLGLRPLTETQWWFPVGLGAAALTLIYGYTGLMALAGITEPKMASQAFENAPPFAIIVVAAVGMAPVIEEIFFRGFLYAGMARRRGWVFAAAVSGLIFSVAHMSPFAIVPFAGVGFLFAWSYKHTGSIKSAIIAHIIVNVVSVTFGFVTAGLAIWTWP